jgi:hypothetical protein
VGVKVGFCVGVFMRFRGRAGWVSGHIGSIGQFGDIWFRFFSTSMEGNVLDKLETS